MMQQPKKYPKKYLYFIDSMSGAGKPQVYGQFGQPW
jgi:hypothetical protein